MHGPIKDRFLGETSLGHMTGFHRKMTVKPLCGRLRARAFHDRLRAWRKGLGENWCGSARSCTFINRLLFIVTCSIDIHCWRYHVHPWKWASESQRGVHPWCLHGGKMRSTNVGGVLLIVSCGHHGLRIFCGCSVTAGGSRDSCGPLTETRTEGTNSPDLRVTHLFGCIFERTRDCL